MRSSERGFPTRSVTFPEAGDVPTVSHSLVLPKGPHHKTIGVGGDRGALVKLLDPYTFPLRVFKEYLHPRKVERNEIQFIATIYPHAHEAFLLLTSVEGEGGGECTQPYSPYHYLVVPEVVVMEGSIPRGIIMPQYQSSLYHFLCVTHPCPDDAIPRWGGEGSSAAQGTNTCRAEKENRCPSPTPPLSGSFRTTQRFGPIRDPLVIASIVFQLVTALSTLHEALPHPQRVFAGEGRGAEVEARGFTHNDLHLANVLIHAPSGVVAVCDFELVHHNPPLEPLPFGVGRSIARLPCPSRHPPFGVGVPAADVWGVGLMCVEMLTGIVPLLDADRALDDFDEEGPLLSLPSRAGGIPVVDWTENIERVVRTVRERDVRGDVDEAEMTRLYDFCRLCLSNTAELEEHESWPLTSQLLSHELLQPFVSEPARSHTVLKNFFSMTPDR